MHGRDRGPDSLASILGAHTAHRPLQLRPRSAGEGWRGVQSPQGAPRAHRKDSRAASRPAPGLYAGRRRVLFARDCFPSIRLTSQRLETLVFPPPRLCAAAAARLLGSTSGFLGFQTSAQRPPPPHYHTELRPPLGGRAPHAASGSPGARSASHVGALSQNGGFASLSGLEPSIPAPERRSTSGPRL